MADVVAVDVGGTTVKAARVSAAGRIEARSERPTPGDESTVEAVVAAVQELRTPATEAVGVAVPGVIDHDAGVVVWSVNLDWRRVPLRADVADATSLPVAVDHDVTVAALAESAARGSDLLFVSLGTGIGAASIVGGQPFRGSGGLAGELGHVPVRPGGEPCGCGGRGCLETVASASAITRRYGAAVGRSVDDAAEVVAALGSDPVADRMWDEATYALADGLLTAIALLDPAQIVLGGGLADAGDALLAPVRAALAERLTWRAVPEVGLATLGRDAGVLGAALLARRAVRSAAGVAS